MPDYQLMTQEGANAKAELVLAGLVDSVLRFFKSGFIPTAFTTLAELEAEECDFDGYPDGGYPLGPGIGPDPTWTGPLDNPGGGAAITSPLVNVAYGPAGDPAVGNNVGGWWIELETGEVFLVGVYSPARAAQVVGDGWPWLTQDIEGKNAPIV